MTAFIFDETDAHRFAELTKQYPLWKIGQMNNCCPHTVWKTIKRHGLSVHDRGEKKKQSFIDDWNDGMDMNQLMWKHGIPSINAVYQKSGCCGGMADTLKSGKAVRDCSLTRNSRNT